MEKRKSEKKRVNKRKTEIIMGDISFTIYILHPFIIRPIEKIIIKIFGLATPAYFLGVVFEIALVVALCSAIQPILKRLRLI